METSLAPSPIDKVFHGPKSLAIATTSAFYFGETLQQIIELANKANLKNLFLVSLSAAANAKFNV